MAAYADLTSLSQTLKLIPQPVQQIISLCEKVSRLLVILEDSSTKSSLTINHLEGQIRDASLEAEDMIEPHISRQVFSKSMSRGVSYFFRKMISSPQMHLRDLEKVIDEFDSILEALSETKVDEKVEEVLQPMNTVSSTAGSSRFVPTNKSTVVGLEQDLIQIKERLTGPPSKLDIISIVGMGGIGKTTLARNLYNDSLIEYYFDIRAWIVVSQEYHLQEMLTGLLDSTGHGGGELHRKSIQQLAEHLYKNLKGRRYLLVMDDIWDIKAWDDVKRYFPDDNNGSRIILTTRLSEVAIYANSDSSIHHMSLLSPKASWDLLRKKVFGEECCPFALEKIGKKIARNCKGLPLAIIAIGGLLSKGSRRENYWNYIAENIKSTIAGNVDDDKFIEILSLSYNSLPHHLRACFLYMGVFPEDCEIFVSKLIKLWIAEGFIKPVIGPKSLEEVAEDYLKDLIDRSLILIGKRNHNGGIKTCIIHDLLRELCMKKAQEDKFLHIINGEVGISPEGTNNPQRRVSIHSNILHGVLPEGVSLNSSVRSLLYFCSNLSNDWLLSFKMSCRLLRVLDALTLTFYEFPIELVELVHLRYLAFIYGGKNKFPASISRLGNLQTLIIYLRKFTSNANSLHLPSIIWEMPQLRHLLLQKSLLPYPLPGINSVALEHLQTLSEVTNFRCTRKVFEMIMPNLKKLGISYYHDRDTEWSLYEFNNFVCLHQLETLKCVFISKDFRADKNSLRVNIPFTLNFAFPPNLKKLTLSGCGIPWRKMTIVGSLPNLQVLKLKDRAFEGLVWTPYEGEFSKLKFLLIQNNFLKHWRVNNCHFPSLEHLSLIYCNHLVEIPSEIGEIPTLQMLELYKCSPSAVDSALLIKEEQQNLENHSLRVRIVNAAVVHNYHRRCTQLPLSVRLSTKGAAYAP